MENKMVIIYPPRFGGFLVVLVRASMLRIWDGIRWKRKTLSVWEGFEKLILDKNYPLDVRSFGVFVVKFICMNVI